MTIIPKFVSRVPSEIKEGIIYISTDVNTAVHLCPCGCKTEIITPIDPNEWKFTYDGETISLYPSVGVWGAQCKSHYWITKNKIEWAGTYSENEIREVRKNEKKERKRNYQKKETKRRWWKMR
jgi:hypothetical protein